MSQIIFVEISKSGCKIEEETNERKEHILTMVRVLIGISGSGKTYRIQEGILRSHKDYIYNKRNICIIERPEYGEYSHLFHPDLAAVYKPDDCMIDSLFNVKKTDIIVDCEDYSEVFMKKVLNIANHASINNNTLTITFSASWDVVNHENQILMMANEIFVGQCEGVGEYMVEKALNVKLKPITKRFDFQRVV